MTSLKMKFLLGISGKGSQVLIEFNPRCGRFYLLPKVHKLGNPGRPVVSTVSFPTSLISKFLDDQLQPLVHKLDSFIKDTNHVLYLVNDIKFEVGSQPLFYTMDVKSLYTFIPNNETLHALKHFLDRREKQDHPTSTCTHCNSLFASCGA